MGKHMLAVAGSLLVLGGCTHCQLTRSTVLTTSTIMDIQYRIVLMNLAMLSCNPESLPAHIDLADGVVQINDEVGFGEAGGLTLLEGGPYGIERFGPNAKRQVTEQWGADATTDPERLVELQDLYRVALGLSPLPPPNAIAYLRQAEQAARAKKKQEKSDSEESDASTTSSGGGGSTPSGGNGSSGNDNGRRVPIEILLTDVPPPGWFHIGCKKEVPKDACYVGCWGDRYAWVMTDGVPALARFTVTVLNVIKYKPGAAGKSRGLAVTR